MVYLRKFGIIAIIILIGVFIMTFQPNTDIKLEKFDDAWGLGDPVIIEKKFYELLPQAESLKDKSIYLQILSQIALTQALQKKFNEAHKTLNDAEALLTPEEEYSKNNPYDLARVRILLERGRVFQQAGNIVEARAYFEKSFEFSKKHKFDFHTINAAHMIAIVAEKPEEKIEWNQRAIEMATSTKDKWAQDWLGPLYNNLGQNYLEIQQFEKALTAFQKALEYRKIEGYMPNIRVAKWAVARALRSLDRLDEALTIQHELIKEYDAIAQSGSYDIPIQMFTLTRGLIYEELAEIYAEKAIVFAKLAYKDLSHDEMFRKTAPERLERLQRIQK